MRLAEDRRGRVPFALVGVLLLVGSVGLTVSLDRRGPADADSRVADVRHEATASVRTALVGAVERAADAAARRPVIDPANTTAGRAINDTAPFRDALRLRIYASARRALSEVTPSHGSVAATASLPPATDARDLRRAKRRVELDELNGSRVAVTIRNLTVAVERRSAVVERTTYAPTVVVRTPVLSLARRVAAFEDRLHGGATDRGLGRRLTANLYAIAWARGYAQYGGAPVGNVLGTRHVELATNAALLDVQRAVLGHRDSRGDRALRRAATRVWGTDLIAGLRDLGPAWTDGVLATEVGDHVESATPVPVATALDRATGRTRVGVNRSADRALRDLLRGREGPSLASVIGDVYEAEVRLSGRTTVLETTRRRRGERPTGWERAAVHRENATTWHRVEAPPEPTTGPGEHVLETYAWRVTLTERTTRAWTAGDRTRNTTTVRRRTSRVVVGVVGRHARTPHAPARELRDAHAPGGPLDGRNFADVRAVAHRRLVEERGGPTALRRRALAGTLDAEPRTVAVDPPAGLRQWLYRDLAALRDRVGNTSVSVRRGALLATNPVAELREALNRSRGTLRDVPATYESAATKARVAARTAYLAAVQRRLAARSDDAGAARDRLEGLLADVGGAGLDALEALDPPAVRAADTPITAVEGAPPYLTTSAVAPGDAVGVTDRTYPLVTRNRNLFTAPYGAAGDAIAEAVTGSAESPVRLRTAAVALRAANRTLARGGTAALASNRSALHRVVSGAVAGLRADLAEAVAAETSVDTAVAETAVATALARWETTHARARAAADGSLVDAIADALGGATATDRDRRQMAVRLAVDAALGNATVDGDVVATAVNATRAAGRRAIADLSERALREATAGTAVGRALSAVPAGLPIAPVAGYWWTTTNAWTVEVRGRYQRFAVSAPAGSPRPSPRATLVRENRTVRADVDGDGTPERLGANRPVTVAVSTTVVVAVPPGGAGVGDVAGDADERSPGWPRPGPTDAASGSLRSGSM